MNGKLAVFVVNSTTGGGAEISAMTVYRYLASVGYNIKIIAINRNEFLNDEKSDSVIQLGRAWKSGLGDTLLALIRFRRVVKKLKPDIFVAHCELPELFCAVIPNFRSRVFAVEHTSSPWDRRKILGWVIRGVLRFRKTIWITVDKSKNKIWLGGHAPIYIANPAAKNEIFQNARFPERIAFIGRIRDEKRPQWAINAAIENSMAIAVIGDGDNKSLLIDRYANYKDLVTFYGYIENPWSRLSPDTLIVMPSKFEGDGLVAVEALINGFPIVLADNQDLRRFGLPPRNYFASESELVDKFRQVKEQGMDGFEIPKSIVLEIQNERDIQTIATKWVQALSLDVLNI